VEVISERWSGDKGASNIGGGGPEAGAEVILDVNVPEMEAEVILEVSGLEMEVEVISEVAL
jgi:hypothetical protein